MVVVPHVHQTAHGIYMISSNEKNNHPVLQQNHASNIKTTTNNVFSVSSKRERIAYYKECLLSPTTSTWIEVIKHGLFVTWPGLAVDTV